MKALPHLTPREEQVAAYLAKRWTNHEIARALVVSTRTVEAHVAHVLAKLEAVDRREAGEVWLRLVGEKDQ